MEYSLTKVVYRTNTLCFPTGVWLSYFKTKKSSLNSKNDDNPVVFLKEFLLKVKP